MTDEIRIRQLTNTRDGITYVAQIAADGMTPLCPHCGQKMNRSNELFENSTCPCWWVGANDGVYTQQVCFHLTPEAEAEYLVRVAKHNEEERAAYRAAVEADKAAFTSSTDAEAKTQIIIQRRQLWHKRNKARRQRVRAAVTSGATFDAAMLA